LLNNRWRNSHGRSSQLFCSASTVNCAV